MIWQEFVTDQIKEVEVNSQEEGIWDDSKILSCQTQRAGKKKKKEKKKGLFNGC